jgi:uncharacterized membrane protein
MPKPPTSQRGRQSRAVVLEPPPPAKRPLLRRFVAGTSGAGASRAAPVAPPRSSRAPRGGREPAVTAGSQAWAPPVDEELGDDAPHRAWRPLASLLLCLYGVGASIYLTIGHYAHYTLSCPATSTFNCEAVTHSPESYVFGIPVAVLGLVFFVPMLALCAPAAWRSTNRYVAPLRLAGVITGVGFVFYLVYQELFVIGKICIWCSSVHLATLLLFVVVVTGWDEAVAPARNAAADEADLDDADDDTVWEG